MNAQPFTHPASGPTVLTPRGQAAAQLARFEDTWKELTPEDRRWFSQWLADLLVDACEDAITSAQ